MRSRIVPTSVSSGWAMSAVRQTTLTPLSVNQRVIVQLSSPPDAAKATVLPFKCSSVRRMGGNLGPGIFQALYENGRKKATDRRNFGEFALEKTIARPIRRIPPPIRRKQTADDDGSNCAADQSRLIERRMRILFRPDGQLCQLHRLEVLNARRVLESRYDFNQ